VVLSVSRFRALVRMANGGVCLSCSALVCALVFLTVDGDFVDITYVASAVAKGAGVDAAASLSLLVHSYCISISFSLSLFPELVSRCANVHSMVCGVMC
jgi:hypothetical protein